MRTLGWLVVCMAIVGCGGGSGADEFAELPLEGDVEGPVVASISLRCSDSDLVSVGATATDPQGIDDLDETSPRVRVFLDADAGGTAVEVKLTFGTTDFFASDFTLTPAYDALMPRAASICSAGAWPVQAVFTDETGHVTQGDVMATVSEIAAN